MQDIPELTQTNTEHILQVLETVQQEEGMQGSPYVELIWHLLELAQVLRGYSPDDGLTESGENYFGNGTLALQDVDRDAIQFVIASLALLPTGRDAKHLSDIGLGFVPDSLLQPRRF
jgi:hypothetical protein